MWAAQLCLFSLCALGLIVSRTLLPVLVRYTTRLLRFTMPHIERSPTHMAHFDIVVIGCGGGPSETNLSSYFVKARQERWTDGILALEAGSGLGALARLLEPNHQSPSSTNGHHREEPVDDDEVLFEDAISRYNGESSPPSRAKAKTGYQLASKMYSCIHSFLVTHAHLDHVSGLIMGAGSQPTTKRIVGLDSVIFDLKNIFDTGKLWPRLAVPLSERAPASFYRYQPLNPPDGYVKVAPSISASVMPVSHGSCEQAKGGVYESSCFFVRNDRSGKEFLFFGDVEPDSLSKRPRTKEVWKVAASKIVENQLDTIFLECSWRSGRPVEQLYGHLTPDYVMEELRVLAGEVGELHALASGEATHPRKRPRTRATTSSSRTTSSSNLTKLGSSKHTSPSASSSASRYATTSSVATTRNLEGVLKGVRLVIIHCKESIEPLPAGVDIRDAITDEIVELVESSKLGVTVVAAFQGMRLEI